MAARIASTFRYDSFGGRRPDEHRLVGVGDVRRVVVGLGVDGDGRDAEALARADDAAGDLAAIAIRAPS